MDKGIIVERWRKQRHDFLNSLQVIMGFLQIGRSQEALDYSKGVADRLKAAGEIGKAPGVDLQVQLIEAMEKAWTLGIDLQVIVRGTWQAGPPPEALEEATQWLLAKGEEGLQRYLGAEAGLILAFEEGEDQWSLSIRWTEDWQEGDKADPWLIGQFLPGIRLELSDFARRLGGEGWTRFEEGVVALGIRWSK